MGDTLYLETGGAEEVGLVARIFQSRAEGPIGDTLDDARQEGAADAVAALFVVHADEAQHTIFLPARCPSQPERGALAVRRPGGVRHSPSPLKPPFELGRGKRVERVVRLAGALDAQADQETREQRQVTQRERADGGRNSASWQKVTRWTHQAQLLTISLEAKAAKERQRLHLRAFDEQ
ncbi:MAG TPA: hypothetical protein VFG86_24655, partial [Chloroflexota bacterium]|nr:hypothetical protein [Chloroflexota bacterium]